MPMKKLSMRFLLCCTISAILFALSLQFAHATPHKDHSDGQTRIPIVFIENKGQVFDQFSKPRPDIRFVVKTPGVSIFFTRRGMQFQIRKNGNRGKSSGAILNDKVTTKSGFKPDYLFYRIDWELEGASDKAVLETFEPTPYQENYYLEYITGKQAITHVKSYRKLVYHNIYPGIDWVIYVNSDDLKYDFIIHPGANPDVIKIKHDGASGVTKGDQGELMVTSPFAYLTEEKPIAYETASGRAVNCQWINRSGYWGYQVSDWLGTLTIDPGIGWGGYLGGDAWDFTYQSGGGLAIDAEGCSYATGSTFSVSNLATTGAYQYTPAGPSFNGFYQPDLFLMKIDKNGELLWSTFVGGEEIEVGGNLAINALGQLYLIGATWSETGISTPGTQQPIFGGPTVSSIGGITFGVADYALFRFDTSGVRIWGTYYGGDQIDNTMSAYGIVADDSGHVYIAGETASSNNMSSPGSYQPGFGGMADAFVAKFDSSGNRLWGTYIGEADYGFANALSIGGSGYLYVAGCWAGSSTIGTPGTAQPVPDNGTNGQSGWLCKLGSDGSLIWNTYLHGYSSAFLGLNLGNIFKDWTSIQDVYADADDNIFVTGNSAADSNFSSPGTYKTAPSGSSPALTAGNGFLARYTSTGQRSFCTYIDGGYTTQCLTLCGSRCQDNIYVAGGTTSTDSMVTVAAPFTSPSMASDGAGFVMQFNYLGTEKIWGTYWGPDSTVSFGIGTYVSDIALDKNGNLQTLGTSNKSKSVTSSYTDTLEGLQDVFVARFREVYIDPYTRDTMTVCLAPDGSGSLQVSFLVSADFDATNIFTAELVSVANSALPPIVLSSQAGNTSGSITCLIGAGTIAPETIYRLRIRGSAPYTAGSCWQYIRFSITPPAPDEVDKIYCLFDDTDTIKIPHLAGNILRWYNSPFAISYDTIAPLPSTANPGSREWHVSQVNPFGCESEKATVSVTVLDTPAVNIDSVSNRICQGSFMPLSGNGDGTLTWTSDPPGIVSTGPGTAEFLALSASRVYLTAQNAAGCKNVDSITLNPVECCDPIRTPTAFSPNNDGLNDQFLPITAGVYPQQKLSVFNRWGQRIFFSLDFKKGWDGTFMGTPCDVGTYFFSLEAKCGNGRLVELKGDLSLVR